MGFVFAKALAEKLPWSGRKDPEVLYYLESSDSDLDASDDVDVNSLDCVVSQSRHSTSLSNTSTESLSGGKKGKEKKTAFKDQKRIRHWITELQDRTKETLAESKRDESSDSSSSSNESSLLVKRALIPDHRSTTPPYSPSSLPPRQLSPPLPPYPVFKDSKISLPPSHPNVNPHPPSNESVHTSSTSHRLKPPRDPVVELTTYYNQKLNQLTFENSNLINSNETLKKKFKEETRKRKELENELEGLKKKKFKFSFEATIENAE
ncbi:hypothetical protein JCM3765_000037 [Sporobolomyces pararoseus]